MTFAVKGFSLVEEEHVRTELTENSLRDVTQDAVREDGDQEDRTDRETPSLPPATSEVLELAAA